MIPGLMMPPGLIGGGVGGGAGFPTITLRSSNQSVGSNTVSVPSGVQAGDIIVFADMRHRNDSSAPAPVTPSGYTMIHSRQNGDNDGTTLALFCKLGTPGDGGATITGMAASDGSVKVVLVFTGPFASLTPGGGVAGSDFANVDNSMTINGPSGPGLIVCAFALGDSISNSWDNTTQSLSGGTGNYGGHDTGEARMRVMYRIEAAGGDSAIAQFNGLLNATYRNNALMVGGNIRCNL